MDSSRPPEKSSEVSFWHPWKKCECITLSILAILGELARVEKNSNILTCDRGKIFSKKKQNMHTCRSAESKRHNPLYCTGSGHGNDINSLQDRRYCLALDRRWLAVPLATEATLDFAGQAAEKIIIINVSGFLLSSNLGFLCHFRVCWANFRQLTNFSHTTEPAKLRKTTGFNLLPKFRNFFVAATTLMS